jgi:hypothetical protein
MGVIGKANDSVISGVLILRGQDHKAVVEVAPDWESYEYKKLDIHESEEDKKFFESALAWDLSVDDKTWADGKNVSAPFPIVVIANVYADFTLVTDSSSKRQAINDRAPLSWRTPLSHDFGYRGATCLYRRIHKVLFTHAFAV